MHNDFQSPCRENATMFITFPSQARRVTQGHRRMTQWAGHVPGLFWEGASRPKRYSNTGPCLYRMKSAAKSVETP